MSRRAERTGSVELIRASAGTGKTFQLSSRYLRLLVEDVPPERILASTFTRKAAGEILDRIVQRLARAACDVDKAEELAGQLGRRDLGRSDFEKTLAQFLKRLDRCRISTLDAHFGQVARNHCLELGLPPSWTIVDESDDVEIREEAIRRTLSEGYASELIHLLAKGETRRAIGKLVEDTIHNLYQFLVDSEPEAWNRLPEQPALTSEQLVALMEQIRDIPLEGKTLEAVQKDLIKISDGDWSSLLLNGPMVKIAKGERTFNRQELDEALIVAYESLLRHMVAVRLRNDRQHLKGAHRLLTAFHQHYEELKHQIRGLRFEDVTRAIDRGWSEVVSRGGERPEHAIDHLLLDEFQDTSPVQWRVLEPQVSRAVSRPGGSLLVVGDTKQAIYGWRGGDARLFDTIESHFRGCGAQSLNQSWRSTTQVLDAVNGIFKTAQSTSGWEKNQSAMEQWTNGFPDHVAAHPEREGYVELVGAENPFVAAVEGAAKLHAEAPHLSIALLVRGNDDVDRLMGMLTARGVPASEESGKKIADSPAVRIILSALRLADHSESDPERLHVASTPLGAAWGLDPHGERNSQRTRAIGLAARLREQLAHDGYGPTIEQWCGILRPALEPRERRRLAQLTDVAYTYESRATLRAMDFVRYVEKQRVSDPTSAMVRVMNYHQSKGLEFDAVFLPDLGRRWISQYPAFVSHRPDLVSRIDGIAGYIPAGLREWMPKPLGAWTEEWSIEAISESLSMLYVALTRAAWALHLYVKPTKGKPTLSSWGGLITKALADGEALVDGNVAMSDGNPLWWRNVERKAEAAEAARSRPLPAAPLRFAKSDARKSRSLPSVSPSSREGGSRVSVRQLMRQGKPEALIRGTVVHALFETLTWRDSVPSVSQLRARLESLEEKPDDLEGTIREFLAWIEAPQMSQLFDRRAQLRWARQRWGADELLLGDEQGVRVANEYRFTLFEERPEGLAWVSGSVDRLTSFGGDEVTAAVIDDYKTDRIMDEGHLDERFEHYRPQLEAYRSAVARSLGLGLNQVAGRLIFVEIDRIVPVF